MIHCEVQVDRSGADISNIEHFICLAVVEEDISAVLVNHGNPASVKGICRIPDQIGLREHSRL